jgi:hypothetical protein
LRISRDWKRKISIGTENWRTEGGRRREQVTWVPCDEVTRKQTASPTGPEAGEPEVVEFTCADDRREQKMRNIAAVATLIMLGLLCAGASSAVQRNVLAEEVTGTW